MRDNGRDEFAKVAEAQLSMIFVGVGIALIGFLLGKYTINPSFPDGSYAGMTRRNWRVLGNIMILLGVACAFYGLVALIAG